MSVVEYIILSIALAIPTMVVMRACALKNRIRLTKGMAFSFIIALEQPCFLCWVSSWAICCGLTFPSSTTLSNWVSWLLWH